MMMVRRLNVRMMMPRGCDRMDRMSGVFCARSFAEIGSKWQGDRNEHEGDDQQTSTHLLQYRPTPAIGRSSRRIGRRGCGRGNQTRSRGPVVVDEILELGMKEIGSEVVLLHLLERLVRRPAIVRHSIDCSHDAGSM